MKKMDVQKLAKVLKVLVTVAFVCNIVALPLTPGLVGIGSEGGVAVLRAAMEESGLIKPLIFLGACWQYLTRVWREPYTAVLTAFLWACGVCTAAILWQARRVLNTIVAGNPFRKGNAVSLNWAAKCFFAVSVAALARMIWSFCYYRSAAPLFTYNALFVPIFALGGLLCLVMSALFRQAAELKEDSDLTI